MSIQNSEFHSPFSNFKTTLSLASIFLASCSIAALLALIFAFNNYISDLQYTEPCQKKAAFFIAYVSAGFEVSVVLGLLLALYLNQHEQRRESYGDIRVNREVSVRTTTAELVVHRRVFAFFETDDRIGIVAGEETRIVR